MIFRWPCGDSRPIAPLFAHAQSDRAIYLGTLSKTMLPGLRIGFAILPPALVASVNVIRFVTSWHPSVLEQYALLAFIARGDFARHVRRSRAPYKERAEALFEAGRHWLSPTHCILRPPGLGAIMSAPFDEDAERLMGAAQSRRIELIPLSTFAVEHAASPGYVLGFAPFDPDTLCKSVRQLGELL